MNLCWETLAMQLSQRTRILRTTSLLVSVCRSSQYWIRNILDNTDICCKGTATIAQFGIFILAGVVWGSVFTTPLSLFSAHPVSFFPPTSSFTTYLLHLTNIYFTKQLLNSAGLLLVTEAILILQPTHTQPQKILGTYIHATLIDLGILSLVAGLVVIEYNKISHKGTHFESPHAILGLTTYILMVIQAVVGVTAFFTPKVYGSISAAKSVYKYHRMSGYLILVMSFATVAAATQTTFNKQTLHIQMWAVVVASLITLVGVVPRIKKSKFGL